MNVDIREATAGDESFLREMLFQAIFVEDGLSAPARSVLKDPAIARYIDGWGRDGDFGLVAELNGQPVGAIWVRLFSADNPGFGWLNARAPELSMAVDPLYRGRGIGTKLLTELMSRLSTRYREISLSVSPNNPVADLYRRLGFVEFGTAGTSLSMKRTFA